MKFRFLGTSACFPEDGGDSPSILINDELLVDTGFHPLDNLSRCGTDPAKIKTVLFTHMHHDHYMGLHNLLFWHMMKKPYPLEELKIYGPAEDVERIVNKALDFLEADRYWKDHGKPTVVPLSGDGTFTVGDYTVSYTGSRHPVAGLLYKITDKSAKTLCLTGDTEYFPRESTTGGTQAEFFRGGDAIVSETALATTQTLGDNHYGHSSVYNAVCVADNAQIPLMFCIHLIPERLRQTVAKAQEIRQAPYTAEYPENYKVYEI